MMMADTGRSHSRGKDTNKYNAWLKDYFGESRFSTNVEKKEPVARATAPTEDSKVMSQDVVEGPVSAATTTTTTTSTCTSTTSGIHLPLAAECIASSWTVHCWQKSAHVCSRFAPGITRWTNTHCRSWTKGCAGAMGRDSDRSCKPCFLLVVRRITSLVERFQVLVMRSCPTG